MPFHTYKDKDCPICGTILPSGSIATPVCLNTDNSIQSKPRIEWVHVHCISDTDERIPICKHWRTKGTCVFQYKCQFRHPSEYKKTNPRAECRHGTWGRRRVYNEGRASALRRWLINVFGIDYLRSGSGILDVAGGKGEVSFELRNLNDIHSTVFDPRPLDLYRYKRKLYFGFYHRNEVLKRFNHRDMPADESDVLLPSHIRGYFEMFDSRRCAGRYVPGQVETSAEDDESTLPMVLRTVEAFDDGLGLARSTAWTTKGLVHEDEVADTDEGSISSDLSSLLADSISNPRDDASESESVGCSSCSTSTTMTRTRAFEGGIEIDDHSKAQDIARNCSVVVGMHPDQAAEHIIDFALANNKPFALIPCCVYHKQFPLRKIEGGSGGYVKRYGELIEYLLAKHPDIHALEMDFDGKNIMLYYLGGRNPVSDPSTAYTHICRGIAQPEMWWALSTNPKKQLRAQCKTKRNKSNGRLDSTPDERNSVDTVKSCGKKTMTDSSDCLVDAFDLFGCFEHEN